MLTISSHVGCRDPGGQRHYEELPWIEDEAHECPAYQDTISIWREIGLAKGLQWEERDLW